MRYTTPESMRFESKRQQIARDYGLTQRQARRLSPELVDQLAHCKDEDARLLLIRGSGESHFPRKIPTFHKQALDKKFQEGG